MASWSSPGPADRRLLARRRGLGHDCGRGRPSTVGSRGSRDEHDRCALRCDRPKPPRTDQRIRSGGGEGSALVFDWLVLFIVLSLARLIGERWSHRRDGRPWAANLYAVQRAFGNGGQNT